MYITREIENTTFLTWLHSNKSCPLFVHGARQIGKTTAVKHFAQNHFKNIYYFNLAYNKAINFIDSKESVIITDEIQIAPTIIKPKYSKMILISSHKITLPIEVYDAPMTGFTFREFLIASNNSSFITTIEEHLSPPKPFFNDIHKKLSDIFSIYLTLGGYPEVIQSYLNSYKSYPILHNILHTILDNTFEEAIHTCKGISYKMLLKKVRYSLPYLIHYHAETFDKATTNLINLLQKTHLFTTINNYQSPEKKHIYLTDSGIANIFLESKQAVLESYVCSNLPETATYLSNSTFLCNHTVIEVNTATPLLSPLIRVEIQNLSKKDYTLTIPFYAFPFLKFP